MSSRPACGGAGRTRQRAEARFSMALKQLTGQRPKLSFRRLIHVSIATQVAVIAVVMAAAVFGASATVSTSNELRQSSNNALRMRSLQSDFTRARLALREYTATGDALRLGPFSETRKLMKKTAASLRARSDARSRALLNEYVNDVFGYFDGIGVQALRQARSGDLEEARHTVNGSPALKVVSEVRDEGAMLQQRYDQAQRDAERNVRFRQYVNVALIALAGFAVLASGLGALLWVRREMMLPMDELATASRKLGRGDLSARVDPRGVEEIALAAGAFNQMASEIEQQVQQLHEASAARSRFVSSVSHELRTPITSLRGYLDLLASGEAGDLTAEQQHFMNIAERNSRLLEELINDLLTLSRVQSGKVANSSEAVDLRALLRELKAEMLPIATEKKIDLVLVDTGELVVSGDSLRLKQAFGNLIGNAIKYSPPGQAVVVRAFRLSRQAVVSVVDWGMGIPKDDLPQLAEPFFRSSSSKQIPGTGLGLPIAKQMVELHGGRLAVESEPGVGSTFTVYLPLRMGDEALPPESENGEDVVADAGAQAEDSGGWSAGEEAKRNESARRSAVEQTEAGSDRRSGGARGGRRRYDSRS